MSHFWFNLHPLINGKVKYFFLIFSMISVLDSVCVCVCVCELPVHVPGLCFSIWGNRFFQLLKAHKTKDEMVGCHHRLNGHEFG